LRNVPPLVGEHSVDVLRWLGYTTDDVRSLQAQGVVE
jgi:crotonobetainyl-CoA:carnitine CoA-transferase CaiB-like acyl-CoA transferase